MISILQKDPDPQHNICHCTSNKTHLCKEHLSSMHKNLIIYKSRNVTSKHTSTKTHKNKINLNEMLAHLALISMNDIILVVDWEESTVQCHPNSSWFLIMITVIIIINCELQNCTCCWDETGGRVEEPQIHKWFGKMLLPAKSLQLYTNANPSNIILL